LKILFYSHTSKISGAEKILLLLIERLNRTRIAPFAVCSGEGPLREAILDSGVPCRAIPDLEARFTVNPYKLLRYSGSVVRTALALRREAKKVKPDLIHANSIRAGLVSTIATVFTGIPVFWHLQDELGFHPISTIIRFFVLSTNRVRLVAASGQTLESFRGLLLRSARVGARSKVVHNVVDTNVFRYNEEARSRIRGEFGIGDGEFLFATIGQITPRKGQKGIIEAFAMSLPEIPKARLLIVGEPMFNGDQSYFDELKDLVIEMGLTESVIFTGFRKDIPELLSALDTVVINSSSEAFVVVGIEGLATGLPVIATDVGGIREMITDGESGLIVSPGGAAELRSALVGIAGAPGLRETFRHNGIRIANERFNADSFVSSMEAFFETAAAGKDRGLHGGLLDMESNA